MPLPPPAARNHLHTGAVVYRGYHRDDGLWDIEAEMSDTTNASAATIQCRPWWV